MRFEILDACFVTLRDQEGGVVLASGLQDGAAAAYATIAALRLRLHMRDAVHIRCRSGLWFFIVHDCDGTVLAASPFHPTHHACERAYQQVRAGVWGAGVDEVESGRDEPAAQPSARAPTDEPTTG